MTSSQMAAQNTSPESLVSMLDWCARMRATEPVSPDELPGFWRVFTYAETSQALSDPATFSSDLSSIIPKNPALDWISQGNFVGMDPPRHRQFRGLVSKAFTPRLVAELEPRITDLVDDLLDAVLAKDRIDLVGDLSYPLPIIVIAELLGVPAEDRGVFRQWGEGFVLAYSGETPLPSDEGLASFAPMAQEMLTYLTGHIRQRRATPRDDLISKLVAAEEDGRTLGDMEIIAVAMALLLAGHVTTTALLANAVLCLDENPAALAELRADRSLIPGAIEEVLRMRPPFAKLARITTREVEIGGTTVPAKNVIAFWLASANRDESVFADPDRFDIHREPNRHLAFGHGIHFCIGAPLARLEARIALEAMLDRYAEMTVAGPVDFHDPKNLVGAKRLPLDVVPAAASA